MEENYTNLPEWIKEYLFKAHNHGNDGSVIYNEDDIIELIYILLKNMEELSSMVNSTS